MNRRELIKASLACAIAPIIPLEAVKSQRGRRVSGIVLDEFAKTYKWSRVGNTKDWAACRLSWDKVLEKTILEPIEVDNFFKKA